MQKIYLKIITILFIFSIFFYSCENDINIVNKVALKNNAPVQTSKYIEAIYSDSAKVKFRLTAPIVNQFSGSDVYLEFPKGMNIWFYDNLLNITSSISANWAISKEKEKIVEAKNNVIVINAKGEKLNTEHLVWDQQKGIIYSDVFVKITTPSEILIGDGFEADQLFTKYVIKKPRGSFNLKK
jgi:LPS export ABC transporter protein LptC